MEHYAVNPLLTWEKDTNETIITLYHKEIRINDAGYCLLRQLIPNGGFLEERKLSSQDIQFVKEMERLGVIKRTKKMSEYFSPLALNLEISNICNLRCKHCYKDAEIDGDESLDETSLKKIVRESKQLGIKRVAIGGGEPFLHPHLKSFLLELNSNGIKTTIITNGTIRDKEIYKVLKKVGAQVNVSIDGPREYHDYLRGVPGAFNRAIENIGLMKRYGITVAIQSTISQENMQLLKNLLFETIFKIKPYGFGVGIELPLGRAESRKSNMLTTKEYYKLMAGLERTFNDKNINAIKLQNLKPLPINKNKHRAISWCSAGTSLICIASNGDIIPCPLLYSAEPKFKLGNIHSDSLIDLWHRSKLLWRLRQPKRLNQCGSCTILCNRCPVLPLVLSNNVWNRDPRCSLYRREND